MRVSKLIELLSRAHEEHGDIPVVFNGSDGEDVEIAGITTILAGGTDKPHHVMICDLETLEAFA